MRTKASDDFLIKLVQDIAALQATIAGFESHLEKIDEKIVEPFQEWLHIVRGQCEKIQSMQEEIVELETELETRSNEIKEINDRIDRAKWYGTGIMATVSLILGLLYSLWVMFSPLIKKHF